MLKGFSLACLGIGIIAVQLACIALPIFRIAYHEPVCFALVGAVTDNSVRVWVSYDCPAMVSFLRKQENSRELIIQARIVKEFPGGNEDESADAWNLPSSVLHSAPCVSVVPAASDLEASGVRACIATLTNLAPSQRYAVRVTHDLAVSAQGGEFEDVGRFPSDAFDRRVGTESTTAAAAASFNTFPPRNSTLVETGPFVLGFGSCMAVGSGPWSQVNLLDRISRRCRHSQRQRQSGVHVQSLGDESAAGEPAPVPAPAPAPACQSDAVCSSESLRPLPSCGPSAWLILGDNVYSDISQSIPLRLPLVSAYRSVLSSRQVRLAFSSVPTYSQIDDHEVANDFDARTYAAGAVVAGLDAYFTFAGSRNPPTERVPAPAVIAEVALQSRHRLAQLLLQRPLYYTFNYGADVQVFVLETRVHGRVSSLQRNSEVASWPAECVWDTGHARAEGEGEEGPIRMDLLGPEQWTRLCSWMRSAEVAGARAVVLASPLTFSGAVGDGWQHHLQERNRLFSVIHRLELPVLLLSGDTHWGTHNVYELSRTRQLRDDNHPFAGTPILRIHEFSASPFQALPFPFPRDRAPTAAAPLVTTINGSPASATATATASSTTVAAAESPFVTEWCVHASDLSFFAGELVIDAGRESGNPRQTSESSNAEKETRGSTATATFSLLRQKVFAFGNGGDSADEDVAYVVTVPL